MIKLIIFDLDGVLAKTEHFHDEALISAINNIIGRPYADFERFIKMQGTTTKHKLLKLKEHFNLTDESIKIIDTVKQVEVLERFKRELTPSITQHNMLKELSKKYSLAVGSNARRENVDSILSKLGITKYFFKILTNNDVTNSKPDPEIYLTIIASAGVLPSETLIFEDSIAGRLAAKQSGANVFEVDHISHVHLETIEHAIKQINSYDNCTDGGDGQ